MICILLAGAVLAVYWQVLRSEFVNLDDTIYVTENEYIKGGFSLEGVKWCFNVGTVAYWHPLTWLSHMLDCELFGLGAGFHHLMSLLIHIANGILVFVVLKRMTGALWQSAFVAAVFAVHPVNVDSVAWVAERKNVLSTLFWLLTIWAYIGYARQGGARRYLITLGLFALGLLAKPMLITLPFVMLLLDYWPLGGLSFKGSTGRPDKSSGQSSQRRGGLQLIWEKVPFFAMAGVSVILSMVAMRRLGITASTELIPLKLRVANALVSYVGYIDKIVFPRNMAVFYPYPMQVATWKSVGALLLLAGLSFVFLWVLRKKAYYSVGWLWFVGTLVPVIGLVQAGLWPSIADRWAYVPMIGLLIVAAWGVGDISVRRRLPVKASATAAGACLMVLMFCAYLQVGHWRNSHSLFTHALKVTKNNYIAHLNLGNALIKDGATAEAMSHYKKAVEIHPAYTDAHYNLGIALAVQGKHEAAVKSYLEALRLQDDYVEVRLRLAESLTRVGRLDEAISHFEKLLESRGDDLEVLNNYALALVQKKRVAEAIKLYNRALAIDPESYEVLNNLGSALAEQRQFDLAIEHLQRAANLNPEFVKTHYNLGSILIRAGRGDEAVECYEKALRLDPDDKIGHNALGQILAEQKKYGQAAVHFNRAIQLDSDFGRAYYNLGMLYANTGRTDEAIARFREVLRIYPNDAEMHCNLGSLFARQGRLDEAIAQFRRALRLDPNLSRAETQLKAALAAKSAGNRP
ncbi:MAG: tetratricopeptide repeat protein [Planctomycetota bacterium]